MHSYTVMLSHPSCLIHTVACAVYSVAYQQVCAMPASAMLESGIRGSMIA